MEAMGPQSATFAPLPGSPAKRSAVLTAAGSYLLHVRLGGVAVAGWPRALHATAAASEASRCATLRWAFRIHNQAATARAATMAWTSLYGAGTRLLQQVIIQPIVQ